MVTTSRSLVAGAALALIIAGTAAGGDFIRGDANQDGTVDIADAIGILAHLFQGGTAYPDCLDAEDSNDDGVVDISDGIAALSFLFLGGKPIPPPFPGCGEDPTPDSLGCEGGAAACLPAPEGSLVKSSACKGSGGGDSPNQECLEWSYADGVLTLRQVNAGFNCCAKAAADVAVEGSTISIRETETYEAGPCFCECLIDLDLEVRYLPPGAYLIQISGPLSSLEVPVDLTADPSGSHCEEREGYPWR